ncbi:MAG: metallophosphoesterase [Candidatus Solibacter sp.]
MNTRLCKLLFYASVVARLGWSQTSPFNIITQDDGGVCQPQRQNSSFYETGCCGAPGRRFCAQILHPGKGPFGASYGCTDPANNLVDNGQCDMRPFTAENANVLPAARPGAGTDVRFVVTSDLHFFRQSYNVSDQINQVAHINEYGAQNGIAAVLLAGDMVTGKGDAKLGAYRLMWEKGTIPASINYPVYVGMGNHDSSAQGNGYGMDGDTNAALHMWSYIFARTLNLHVDRNGTGCLVGVDALCPEQFTLGGSLNYSWDWHGVHFVQLHTWAGDTDRQYSPPLGLNGLEWLKRDLAHYVGNSGRPVVLIQHYRLTDGWFFANKDAFKAAVLPYNVIAMFAGHSHGLEYFSQANFVKGGTAPLENFVDGSGGDCTSYGNGLDPCSDATANFLGARITDKFLEVGAYSWNRTTPTYPDTRMLSGNVGYPYNLGPGSCRKRISGGKVQLTSSQVQVRVDAAAHTLYVKNLSTTQAIDGEVVVRAVANGLTRWDFTESCDSSALPFQTVAANGLAPNQEIGMVYTAQGANITAGNVTVFLYSPDILATPSSVTMTSNTAQVTVASPDPTVRSTFNAISSQQWLSVTADSTSLPATLTLSVVPGSSYPDGTIAIIPADSRLDTIKIPIRMGNRPLNITSNATQASIQVGPDTVLLPYNNLAQPGSRIDLRAPDHSPAPGTQYRFESWSNSGPRNQNVTVPLDGLTLSVQFGTWYHPTLSVNPPGAGTLAFVTPTSDGFYRPGPQTLAVQAAAGYRFTGFSGDVTGTSTAIQLGGPWVITANFMALPRITFSSNLPASETASLTVGGTNYPFPSTVTLDPGTVSIAAPALVVSALNSMVRYTFVRWSDGVTAAARSYTVAADGSLTAIYASEVLVSVTANPANLGSVTGGGWIAAGSSITLRATANAGAMFTGFTGDLVAVQSPASFTAGATGANIVANFRATPADLYAFQSGAGADRAGGRVMPISLSNTGGSTASAARIESIGPIVVVSGSGTVTVQAGAVSYGDVAAGASVSRDIVFNWPDTAKRIRITVNISAGGGTLLRTSVLNLIR